MSDIFLSARWEDLIMANYAIDPELLKPYLPHGVELDFHEGKTYVSLVGFMFKRTSLFNIPIPFLGTFEEVNLRFYVKRVEENEVKRGVVFISETVPYKAVAWLANKLYKEHYIAIPTRSLFSDAANSRQIKYEWKINKSWNQITVNAAKTAKPMLAGSIEEFIFEHYYGYTRIDDLHSQEYRVDHPRWEVSKVIDYSIDCDFRSMYGNDFSFLSQVQPDSVFLAEGSPVTVKWKRTSI